MKFWKALVIAFLLGMCSAGVFSKIVTQCPASGLEIVDDDIILQGVKNCTIRKMEATTKNTSLDCGGATVQFLYNVAGTKDITIRNCNVTYPVTIRNTGNITLIDNNFNSYVIISATGPFYSGNPKINIVRNKISYATISAKAYKYPVQKWNSFLSLKIAENTIGTLTIAYTGDPDSTILEISDNSFTGSLMVSNFDSKGTIYKNSFSANSQVRINGRANDKNAFLEINSNNFDRSHLYLINDFQIKLTNNYFNKGYLVCTRSGDEGTLQAVNNIFYQTQITNNYYSYKIGDNTIVYSDNDFNSVNALIYIRGTSLSVPSKVSFADNSFSGGQLRMYGTDYNSVLELRDNSFVNGTLLTQYAGSMTLTGNKFKDSSVMLNHYYYYWYYYYYYLRHKGKPPQEGIIGNTFESTPVTIRGYDLELKISNNKFLGFKKNTPALNLSLYRYYYYWAYLRRPEFELSNNLFKDNLIGADIIPSWGTIAFVSDNVFERNNIGIRNVYAEGGWLFMSNNTFKDNNTGLQYLRTAYPYWWPYYYYPWWVGGGYVNFKDNVFSNNKWAMYEVDGGPVPASWYWYYYARYRDFVGPFLTQQELDENYLKESTFHTICMLRNKFTNSSSGVVFRIRGAGNYKGMCLDFCEKGAIVSCPPCVEGVECPPCVCPECQPIDLNNQAPQANFEATPREGESPLIVDFYDKSTDPDGQIVSWQWNFGDNTSDSVQNPEHTFTGNGPFTVTLTVTDDKGASNSVQKKVWPYTVGTIYGLSADDVSAGESAQISATCNKNLEGTLKVYYDPLGANKKIYEGSYTCNSGAVSVGPLTDLGNYVAKYSLNVVSERCSSCMAEKYFIVKQSAVTGAPETPIQAFIVLIFVFSMVWLKNRKK